MLWILFAIPSILIASTIHEYAHAYAAFRLGDATAKASGRMTLNPIAHIDPIGALMMVIARFGWSKPVPINEYNFENPVRGTAISAFAGPLSNLITAGISAILFRLFLPLPSSVEEISTEMMYVVTLAVTFIMVNVTLAVFNLLPVPPLDGHKIVRAFLPASVRYYWEKLENFGIFILLAIFLPFSPLSIIVQRFLSTSMNTILTILIG